MAPSKDMSKWETFDDESTEIASKCLKINEMGNHANNSILGTPGTPNTPTTPTNENTPTRGATPPNWKKSHKRKAMEKVEDPVLDT